jgi:hypothetical protein
MFIINFKNKIKNSNDKLVYKIFIIGGILLIIDNWFLGSNIINQYSIFRLDLILIIYFLSLLIFSIYRKKIDTEQLKFSIYFIPYFIFFASIISISINSLVYLNKSDEIKAYNTKLTLKYKGTLKTSSRVDYMFNKIHCSLSPSYEGSIESYSFINIRYSESIFGAKVIEKYWLY